MGQEKKSKILKISGEVIYKIQGSVMSPVSVMVRELRNDGLKFVTTENLAEKTVLDLAIKVTEDSDPINVVGTVICQGHGASRFLLDTTIEFTEISPKEESRLLNFITHSADHIKAGRCHVRCPMEAVVRYSKVAEQSEEAIGQAVDIGILGMQVYVEQDISNNTDLNVLFDLPRGRGSIRIMGTVVWKGPQAGDIYPIGLKFTEIENRDKQRILRYINYTITDGESD
ncbi:MAG: PilZ domain-containing protein [Candidatus Omnitrophica bacterium]|nr:PilZ domain-containing protein [Candidatus Omnitrophota bacterium]